VLKVQHPWGGVTNRGGEKGADKVVGGRLAKRGLGGVREEPAVPGSSPPAAPQDMRVWESPRAGEHSLPLLFTPVPASIAEAH